MKVRSDYTYEDLPEYAENVPGAKWIETTGNEQGVYIVRDVVYCTVNGQELKLQIIIPTTRNSEVSWFIEGKVCSPGIKKPEFPCIMFVQGSAWMEQTQYTNAGLGDYSLLARRGIVVAIVECRHSGIAYFPAQVIDTRNAIRFMKLHAKEYFVDAKKVLVGGNSSGGHIAMFAGIYHNDENTTENLFPGISAEVKGIINQYGSTDFTFEDSNPNTEDWNLPTSPQGIVMGKNDLVKNPDLAHKLSVKCNIFPETSIAPSLILHGTKDRLVNTKCSVYLYERLKECGKDTELILLKGADHGGPEFFSNSVLDIQEAFIRKCVKAVE